jgi:hypothetical protein
VANLQQARWGGPAGGSLYPLHGCGLLSLIFSILNLFNFLKINHLFFIFISNSFDRACMLGTTKLRYPTTCDNAVKSIISNGDFHVKKVARMANLTAQTHMA